MRVRVREVRVIRFPLRFVREFSLVAPAVCTRAGHRSPPRHCCWWCSPSGSDARRTPCCHRASCSTGTVRLIGFGIGNVITSSFQAGTSGVDTKTVGVASAVVNTSQQIGGSIGTALLNTLATAAGLRTYRATQTAAAGPVRAVRSEALRPSRSTVRAGPLQRTSVRARIAMSSCRRPPVQSVTSVTSVSTTSDAERKSRSASLVRGS